MAKSAQQYIDGVFSAPTGYEEAAVINPATEEVIGTVRDSSTSDIDTAVRAAGRALRSREWAESTPKERADVLRALADAVGSRADALASDVTAENGTPVAQSPYASVGLPVAAYRHAADLADGLVSEQSVTAPDGTESIIRREPIGVVAAIVPWNAPQALLAYKLGPALAAGNTVVIKPAPETSLDIAHLMQAAEEAGIPPGVINVIQGTRDAGQTLVSHTGVNKISFTGSTEAGRRIASIAGQHLKRMTMELGGKSAAILLDDADLATFTGDIPFALLPSAGQACWATTRVLAPHNRYDEVVDSLAEFMSSIPVGDPAEQDTVFGPLVAERQRDRVENYIRIGLDEGAKLVTGGGRVRGLSRGWYIEPTVFRNADNSMRIAREEIFGPVLTVIPYDNDDEAVAIANDSEYGLGGAVYTRDASRGRDIARRVQTGTIGINRYAFHMNAPFGGMKASGLGRENGPFALDAYMELKAIHV